MVYKMKYTMYDNRQSVEYVRTWSGMLKILARVLRHKWDDVNVKRVDVYKVDHVPILTENLEEEYVQSICFADK